MSRFERNMERREWQRRVKEIKKLPRSEPPPAPEHLEALERAERTPRMRGHLTGRVTKAEAARSFHAFLEKEERADTSTPIEGKDDA